MQERVYDFCDDREIVNLANASKKAFPLENIMPKDRGYALCKVLFRTQWNAQKLPERWKRVFLKNQQFISRLTWDGYCSNLTLLNVAHFFKNLKHLQLTRAEVILDPGMKSIAALQLQSLSISSQEVARQLNPPMNEMFKHLSTGKIWISLRALNLRRCEHLRDSSMPHIGKLMLRSLDLSCALIGDAGMKYLASGTIKGTLRVLSLKETGITDESVRLIQNLALESLDLSETLVSDKALKYLAEGTAHKTLQSLDVSNTKVTNQGLLFLRFFQNLSFLNVSSNQVKRQFHGLLEKHAISLLKNTFTMRRESLPTLLSAFEGLSLAEAVV